MAITILSHYLNNGSALILRGIGSAKASWRAGNFLKHVLPDQFTRHIPDVVLQLTVEVLRKKNNRSSSFGQPTST
jgi:hypothetical protein